MDVEGSNSQIQTFWNLEFKKLFFSCVKKNENESSKWKQNDCRNKEFFRGISVGGIPPVSI
jgi:hypothetical protein